MAKGSSQSALLSVAIMAGGVFLVWDYFFNPPCKRIFPLYNMIDVGCGARAGLIMDPMRVGNVLRGARQSAGGEFNKNVDDLLKEAVRRGSQPVREFTLPSQPGSGPKSGGRSQAVKPSSGTYTGRSGAPRILGRPTAGPSPFSFEKFLKGLNETFSLKDVPRTWEQYQRYLRSGGGLGFEDWFKLPRPSVKGGFRAFKPTLI